VTQRPFLTAGSVRDNLTLGNLAWDDRIWSALREVGLDGVVAGLPYALATPIGDDGFGLSAGQRARLVVARALLSDVDAVLLDEPTAHLDTEAANAVHHAILRLAEWRPVLVVTHRPELVAVADHHVDLGAGVAR
jgi:ATP-binding cassette subfamily C protein CydD/ATP-binding cassette subfamily C protein CydCD